ncbi:pentapeptide repeat-containing protein [Streptomyces capoamus]|uniref:pentapeptide repeat-containing protein n=1 Tax=Streptomyces capoamus TaxID=68183 RepID=UPI003C30667A
MVVSTGVVLFVLLIWKGPWWADEGHLGSDLSPGTGAVVTGFRTTVVAVGAGIIACLGLYYTDRNLRHTREKDREQASLIREGQVTERYVAAVKLLASAALTERLGGIYALERIMHDSPKDQFTVTKVLAAFLRQHPTACATEHDCGVVGEDVMAAFSAIARRPRRLDQAFSINLRGLNVCGVELYGYDPESRADLESIDLDGACLKNADLELANLCTAGLSGSNLEGANLSGADLSVAKLNGAHLKGANITQANLIAADLTDATGLEVDSLLKSEFNAYTHLPSEILADERIKKLIDE